MTDRKIVQAVAPFATSVAGVPHMVAKNDLYYEDDAVVRANRVSFQDAQIRSSTGASTREPVSSGSVETASAEPGGRRRLSKPPKTDSPEPGHVTEPSEV